MAKKNAKATVDSDDSEKIEVKGAPKVNDIAKPGESPPSPTSRPIITNRTGMIKQDPMVSGKPDEEESKADQLEDKDSEDIEKKTELNIKPVDSGEDTEQTGEEKPEKPEEQEAQKEEPVNEEEKASEEKADEPAEDSAEETDSSTSDSAAIDSLATNAEAKKAASKVAEEEQKKADKIQGLIDSKKYYVPIVEGGHKASSQRFATWLLIILLVFAILVYLAIDAGYLDVGISLPFDLIKN